MVLEVPAMRDLTDLVSFTASSAVAAAIIMVTQDAVSAHMPGPPPPIDVCTPFLPCNFPADMAFEFTLHGIDCFILIFSCHSLTA